MATDFVRRAVVVYESILANGRLVAEVIGCGLAAEGAVMPTSKAAIVEAPDVVVAGARPTCTV